MRLYWLSAIFIASVTILLLNRYTPLYINNDVVHFILLLAAIYTLLLLTGHVVNRLKSRVSALIAFAVVAVICFLKAFLTWGGEWKTQTILYRSRDNSRITVEYQMRGDRFSFGYKKRVVERLRVLPAIDWISTIDTLEIDPTQWRRTNERINALGLKDYDRYGK